jgi:hypothetical protein
MLQDKADSQGISLKDISMKWSARAFDALDTEGRGFIYKDELLNHIKASGTITN